MRAVTADRYGPADILKITETARPEPGPDEILVKVAAAGVTTADWRLRASAFPLWSWLPGRLMFGLLRPKSRIPGSDFAGRVVARGRNVANFRPGDAVFGSAGQGAHAEYLAVRADGAIAPIPQGITFDQAAAIPFGALAALVFLRDMAGLRAGETVLIAGATGGVGAYAVQIARALGGDVTALASAEKRALALSLGARQVIDYRTEDFSAGPARFDVILDPAGVTGWRMARRALMPAGRFAALEIGVADMLRALWTRLRGGRRMIVGISGDSAADLRTIAAMMADGRLRPVIDSRYPLDQIAKAHARVETRHKAGAVIVQVDPALPVQSAA